MTNINFNICTFTSLECITSNTYTKAYGNGFYIAQIVILEILVSNDLGDLEMWS